MERDGDQDGTKIVGGEILFSGGGEEAGELTEFAGQGSSKSH